MIGFENGVCKTSDILFWGLSYTECDVTVTITSSLAILCSGPCANVTQIPDIADRPQCHQDTVVFNEVVIVWTAL